ncbi:MAG: WD40 repeat domain-containing protein, partial [Patescibacteria group bacterium]
MDLFIKYKKILLIVGFITIVLILGYTLYLFFFKPTAPTPQTPESISTTTSTGLPVSPAGTGQIITPTGSEKLPGETTKIIPEISQKANGGLTQTTTLNNLPSLSPTLSSNGASLQYYNLADGKFYQINQDGKITALSDKTFYNVENITWSPNKNKAILEYPDGSNIVYDFMADKQVTLPKHWEEFDFSPNGDQLVLKSIGLDEGNRWLAVSNEDGSKSRIIEALGDKDETVYPSWSPNNQIIAMYTEGIDFDRQEVFFVGLNNENFKSTVIEGRGFEPLWSTKGDKLIYSVYTSSNDLKPMLWLVNAQGEAIGSDRKNLKVETWASKCTFNS